MRAVNFASNRHRRPQPIIWNNFLGVNEVDDNTNLPANQVPYAQNIDFGRFIGSAGKRLGMEALFASLGAGGCKGQHTYQRSSGEIPLIGWGTDVYKLSGASNTVVKDTYAEFNAGTKTDITVLADDYIKPATVPTLAEGAVGLPNGAYRYKVSNVDKLGIEGALSEASNPITVASKQIAVSAIPTGPSGTTMRKVYRTKAGGSVYYALAFIGDNTTTTLADNTADASLTSEHVATRAILAQTSTTKGTEVITQAATNFNLSHATTLFGQTITIPAGVTKIQSISLSVTGLIAGKSLTVTLYTDTTKATTLGTATVAGPQSDGYIDFAVNAVVAAGGTYFFELSNIAGLTVAEQGTDVYAGGQLYANGTPVAGQDMTFKVFAAGYKLTGTYLSDAIDLTSAPSTSALSFAETLSSQLIAWYARGSLDNQSWGDWHAIESSGDGLPLTRYLQIKAVLTTDTATVTPIITSYTITYTIGYGTATSIKGSLTGNRVSFTDWDDKCYFTDGGKPQSYDGTTVAEVGTGAATDPPESTIVHQHKNYFFYVETAAPSRVYVSLVNTPANIPTASYFQFPGPVLAIKSHGDYLVVSGSQFIQYTAGGIFDVDPSVGDWDWKEISVPGCISHDAMISCVDAEANQMLIMPTKDGLRYLSANLLGSLLQATPLSRNVQHYFDEAITRESMSAVFFNQAYYIAFNWSDPAGTPGAHNNVVFKLDLRNREWSGPWFMDVSGFMVINKDLYFTSSTIGRVFKHAGTSDDGTAINMILDSNYRGSYEKRNFTKLIAEVKRGSVTDDTTVLTRVDNLERTIALGACTGWAGAGGSARDVQDAVISPQKTISGGRGYNMGWRVADNSTNDVVLYGITVLAEPPR